MVGWLAYQQDITNSDAHHQDLVCAPFARTTPLAYLCFALTFAIWMKKRSPLAIMGIFKDVVLLV